MANISPLLVAPLEALADALVPLAKWMAEKKYVPPNAAALPWRVAGAVLNAKSLRVVEFLEGLLEETAGDDRLLERFRAVAAEPLSQSPHANAEAWRKARGLEAEPVFGIVESQNVLLDADNQPIARTTFYATHLPLFAQMIASAEALGRLDWNEIAADLLVDMSPFWPQGAPKSSLFVKQYLKDVLYAVLGRRRQSFPWDAAVLTELGEYRSPGNKYTAADAVAAVDAYRAVVNAPAPQVATAAPPQAPPAGSPPGTTKREHQEAS